MCWCVAWVNLRNHMFCDTGWCRASITAGRTVGDARAQGKPQPDARVSRELEGEAVNPERANDRKITADVKEGPGDRSGKRTLASTAARLRWMHGNTRTRHKLYIVETSRRSLQGLSRATAEHGDILIVPETRKASALPFNTEYH